MFQAIKKINLLINEAKKYAKYQLLLIKIDAAKKTASVMSMIIAFFFVALLLLLTFFFFSVGLAFYLGKVLNRYDWGFMIIAIGNLIFIVIIWKLKRYLFQRPIYKNLVAELLKNNKE